MINYIYCIYNIKDNNITDIIKAKDYNDAKIIAYRIFDYYYNHMDDYILKKIAEIDLNTGIIKNITDTEIYTLNDIMLEIERKYLS